MSYDMKGKVAVVTGGVNGIGAEIVAEFKRNGAIVCIIDKEPNDYFTGDLAEECNLIAFANKVIAEHGKIDYIVNNGMAMGKGLLDASYEDFNYVLRVGITAPFYLTKLFKDHFNQGASIVNISSSRYNQSQSNTESYTATKGGITALTHGMAVTLQGIARVNAIAPGWINVSKFGEISEKDKEQHLVKRVGEPKDIAKAVMFLCSEDSGFMTAQCITIDGGMSKLMVYHNDENWSLK